MSQPCAFVDPSSLSLPSTSNNRLPSPACSTDDSAQPSPEPPRKRPRSAVTPEERKEARAHRNRIAAQNSRDRRKAQFSYLERRVAELEDENRRLRAGILTPSAIPPLDTTLVEHEQEQRKREEGQRERENRELRERIRTLEKGYEAVVRALAAQGNLSAASGMPTPPATSPAPTVPSLQPSSQSASHTGASEVPLSAVPSLPLSPNSSNSTLESPLLFTNGDSFDFPQSPAFSVSDTSLAPPQESLNLSLTEDTPTRHLARVANTVDHTVSLQRVGGVQMVVGPVRTTRRWTVTRPRFPEDEAASDAVITRLFAEILTSPPPGSRPLPSSSTSPEDAFSKEMLTKTETKSSNTGLGKNSINTAVDWVEQVRAEIEMEKLLDMLPNVQDVGAILNSSVSPDVDMDFSSALSWDGVSVF